MRPILIFILFISVSVSLGTAFSALGRLLLFLMALAVLLPQAWARCKISSPSRTGAAKWRFDTLATAQQAWKWAIVLALAYMALSVAWSDAPQAWGSWARHARWLSVILMTVVLVSAKDAQWALRALVLTQLFVVVSAYLMVAGWSAPWVTSKFPAEQHAVFGSQLEQTITQAVTVFLLWNERRWIFGPRGQALAVGAALATTVLTLGFMAGRTGHLVFFALLLLSVWQVSPRRWRWPGILAALALIAGVVAGSGTVRSRMLEVWHESADFTRHGDVNTSSGERLYYWTTSIKSIADHPLLGSGSGSFNHELRRLSNPQTIANFATVDNPHQTLLLWTVEGGVVGGGLLLLIVTALFWRAQSLPTSPRHSLQASLLALVVAGSTTSSLYGIGMGDFFCVLIGTLLAMAPAESGSPVPADPVATP